MEAKAQKIFDNAIMLADKVLKEYVANYYKKPTAELFEHILEEAGWLGIQFEGKKFRLGLACSFAAEGTPYSEEYVAGHPALSQHGEMLQQHASIMMGMVELLYNKCLERYLEEKHGLSNVFKKEGYRLSFEDDTEAIIVVISESI
jgi:hypothetical protein